ncbi:MAG: HlyD family efflux transporter periplasmic adaptor subunit [Chlorobi bacterium]|nr:HlyD family efflux transporter periplasmic adaptor subunit [Chlorobiota bacterium]
MKNIKKLNFKLLLPVLLFIISVFSWQCSGNKNTNVAKQELNNNEHDEEHGEEHGEKHEEELVVQLTDSEMKEFGIETSVAGEGNLQIHVNLPGEVIIPPDNLAHVHPRFPGMVKAVYKEIGDEVVKGEVLAIIESNESLVEYKMKSLIDGTIIEKHITRGEVVEDSEHGFVIADLTKLWVYLSVYQKDLPYVKIGQSVVISAGEGLPTVKAKISYISPVIDEITRTATARVELSGNNNVYKPGLFVTGSITTTNIRVSLSIPKTAIETLDNKPVVFVKTGEGFKPHEIKIGRKNDINVEVISGIKPGDVYVSKRGFTLKAELQKSEFGEGHGH